MWLGSTGEPPETIDTFKTTVLDRSKWNRFLAKKRSLILVVPQPLNRWAVCGMDVGTHRDVPEHRWLAQLRLAAPGGPLEGRKVVSNNSLYISFIIPFTFPL